MLLAIIAAQETTIPDDILEPIHPNLNIEDSETISSVPVIGISGWGTGEFIQTLSLCNSPMEFVVGSTPISVGNKTQLFWCKRMKQVLLSVEFTENSATCNIYPIYIDKNDIEFLGAIININATEYQKSDSIYYSAVIEPIEVYGAQKIGFYIESISIGNIYLSIAVV